MLLLLWQSLAFYSNRVTAADLGYSHFLWAGTFIMFFRMKFKFSKKIKTVYDFIQNLFFFNWIVMLFHWKLVSWINYSCNAHLTKKLRVYLNAERFARLLLLHRSGKKIILLSPLGGPWYGANIWVQYRYYLYLSLYTVLPPLHWVWILFVIVTLHQWSANFFYRGPDHLFNSYWRPTTFAITRTKRIRHRQYAIAV